MRTTSIITALLLLAGVLQAAPYGLDFGMKQTAVAKKLKNSGELERNPAHKGKKIDGAFITKEQIAKQPFTLHFTFKKKTLDTIKWVGERAFGDDEYDEKLKAYYVATTQAMESKHNVRPQNTPPWKKASEIKKGQEAPMHSYMLKDGMLTVGVERSADDGKFHVIYTLQKVTHGGMGIAGITTGGSLDDWKNIKTIDTVDGASDEGDDEFIFDDEDGGDDTAIADTGDTDSKTPGKKPAPAEDERDTITEALVAKGIGLCFEKDRNSQKTAFDNFQQAAERGNGPSSARAYFLLAQCYETGLGTRKSNDDARKMNEKAAQLGFAPSLVKYGSEYRTATSALRISADDSRKLIETCRNEAAAGSASAQFNMGILHRYGYGVRKDLDKARAYFEQAAAQGDKFASIELKKMDE